MHKARLAVLAAVASVALAAPGVATASTLPFLEQDPIYNVAEHSRHDTVKNSVGNIR